ncbi:MAG: hypothetical protein R6W77_11740, partial [Trueperaceae bacterium]
SVIDTGDRTLVGADVIGHVVRLRVRRPAPAADPGRAPARSPGQHAHRTPRGAGGPTFRVTENDLPRLGAFGLHTARAISLALGQGPPQVPDGAPEYGRPDR